jgi:hypothetical protein
MKKLTLKKTTLSRLNENSLVNVRGGNNTGPVNEPPVRCTAIERASCVQHTSNCPPTEINCDGIDTEIVC